MKESKILVVDDIEANVMLLKRILQLGGYSNILSTSNPEEVVSIYKEHSPDLILLDLYMPKKSGLDVLDDLNKVKGDMFLPVIVVTAQDNREGRLLALEKGAKDFVVKPFEGAEMLLRISNMLEMVRLYKKEKQG